MSGEEFLIQSLKLYLCSDHFDKRCSVSGYDITFMDEVLEASSLEEIWEAFIWLDSLSPTATSASRIIIEALNFVSDASNS